MKSLSKELLDRATAAMLAAIEIYNKPGFPYRAESFTILAINGWELLLKAKWLALHKNKSNSLYVYEKRTKADGSKGKKNYIKKTRSGNPFTYSIDSLAKKLIEKKALDPIVWSNIQLLLEFRDSSIHFYESILEFRIRLQEIGAACTKNFSSAIKEWFDKQLAEFELYLMPLAFIDARSQIEAIPLGIEEKNFLHFMETLDKPEIAPNSPYSVTVNIEINFTRSKAKDALAVRLTNDPNATQVRLSEEQIHEKYPWSYQELYKKCRERYLDFKMDKKFHDLRKKLHNNNRFSMVRFLDPKNPKSSKKPFYSPNILNEFDKHYKIVDKTH